MKMLNCLIYLDGRKASFLLQGLEGVPSQVTCYNSCERVIICEGHRDFLSEGFRAPYLNLALGSRGPFAPPRCDRQTFLLQGQPCVMGALLAPQSQSVHADCNAPWSAFNVDAPEAHI